MAEVFEYVVEVLNEDRSVADKGVGPVAHRGVDSSWESEYFAALLQCGTCGNQ